MSEFDYGCCSAESTAERSALTVMQLLPRSTGDVRHNQGNSGSRMLIPAIPAAGRAGPVTSCVPLAGDFSFPGLSFLNYIMI